ncbi:hypothetical protein MLD38_032804 [Melastoma candidum]|uniref:Uncharacterized protein n=1 Tax=Melastoma candidum TaxID=119954 RepID=A0ACB9M6R9_9MYRT|nr:hypothetical protein MLD38_032804 [Melastoma candidum]
MEPRRERRPNVRLEELGDIPAAVACGVISSPGCNTGPARKRWRRHDPVHPPTSWDGLPHLKSDEEEEDTRKPPELDFGTVTRKSRLMNRRGRTAMGNNRVFAGSWGIRYSPGISGNDGKEEEEEEEVEESARCASDSPSVDPSGGTRHSREVIAQVSSVGRWLEEIGFGKYAGVFEMHEVDEEALPLLTIQDLKEMGFSAVGPRRKLYEAIRRVAGSEQSTRTGVPPEED